MPPNLALPIYPAWTQLSEASADLEARLAGIGTGSLTKNGYLDVSAYAGATAAAKAIAALNALDATGVFLNMSIVLDFRRLTGVQVLDQSIRDVAFHAMARPQTAWLWGSCDYRVTASQRFGTDEYHQLTGARFTSKDVNGVRVLGKTIFQSRTNGCLVAINAGSVVATPVGGLGAAVQTWARIGSPLAIYGQRNSTVAGGSDTTTITVDPGAGGVTISVVSTVGFGNSGHFRVDNEIIAYTGVTANTFTGCARGYQGSVAAAHAAAAVCERVTYDVYYIVAIDGVTGAWTLDRQQDVTATTMDCLVGTADAVFDGGGTIDGNQDPVTDDVANPYGIHIFVGRGVVVGPGITVQNCDHVGIVGAMAQDCRIYAKYRGNGRQGLTLGGNLWMFGRCYRNSGQLDVVGGYIGLLIDDRSTTGTFYDGACTGNSFEILSCLYCNIPAMVSSSPRNSVVVRYANGYTDCAILIERSNQWVTNTDPIGCYFRLDAFVRGAGATSEIRGSALGSYTNITVDCPSPGAILSGLQLAMSIRGPKGIRNLGNTATQYAPDLNAGDYYQILATTNPFTLLLPLNPYPQAELTLELQNGSGGVMTPTFNAIYHFPGAVTAIAAGLRRVYKFVNIASQWVCVFMSPADIT